MKLLKRDGMAIKVEELERIISALRSGTDLHASTVLARLRLGERLEDVAKSLPPTTSSQARSNRYMLSNCFTRHKMVTMMQPTGTINGNICRSR